jgi:hypothetical protein
LEDAQTVGFNEDSPHTGRAERALDASSSLNEDADED